MSMGDKAAEAMIAASKCRGCGQWLERRRGPSVKGVIRKSVLVTRSASWLRSEQSEPAYHIDARMCCGAWEFQCPHCHIGNVARGAEAQAKPYHPLGQPVDTVFTILRSPPKGGPDFGKGEPFGVKGLHLNCPQCKKSFFGYDLHKLGATNKAR
jgi:hypothetical protein